MIKGFDRVTGGVRKRIIARVVGRDKCGKTTLALTAPGPCLVFDMDRGLEGVIERFLPKKEIYSVSYREMLGNSQEEHVQKWSKFTEDYHRALAEPELRTIIVDTENAAWEMVRMARFGKLTQVKPHHYGPVNKEFSELVDAAFDSDKNLILLAREKKEYKGGASGSDSWTGKWEPGGFSHMQYIVQVNLRVFRDAEGFGVEIVNCRQNSTLFGEVFHGELCTFPTLATMILEGTTPEDWE